MNMTSSGRETMMEELQRVALMEDLPQHALRKGDVGTIVMVYDRTGGYEVEFCALSGDTLAVTVLSANQIRPVSGNEVSHARSLAL